MAPSRTYKRCETHVIEKHGTSYLSHANFQHKSTVCIHKFTVIDADVDIFP